MNIIVFVKETVGKNAPLSSNNTFPGDREEDDVAINDYDKHALEAALQIVENVGEGKVTAVSFGSNNADKVLKRAIAMGTHEAIRIDNSEKRIIDSFRVAKVLAKGVEKIGDYNIVLFGMQSYDGGSASVPPMVAEFLNLAHACWVEKIQFGNGSLVADKVIEGGTRSIRIQLPCVLSIASTGDYEEPRYTSVRRIMKASRTKIPVWSIDELEADTETQSNVSLTEITEPPVRAEKCVIFKEDEPSAMVEQLVNALKEKGLNLAAFKE
ncbi:MAG: electron transfer flavoprotein subunit beta/FixA family protein [Candidatus Hodarchaeota archaeon]